MTQSRSSQDVMSAGSENIEHSYSIGIYRSFRLLVSYLVCSLLLMSAMIGALEVKLELTV